MDLRQEDRCPRANIFDDLVTLEACKSGSIFRENVAELNKLYDS